MVNIPEILPLMVDSYMRPVGWKPIYDSTVNKVLNPGQVYHVGPWDKPGYMRAYILVSDNPYVKLSQTVYSVEKPIEWTFFNLFVYGQIRPGPSGFTYLDKYDVANSIYLMFYQPQPIQEFLPSADVWVTAPSVNPVTGTPITTPSTITSVVYCILIDDVDRFTAKMQEVLGTGKVTA